MRQDDPLPSTSFVADNFGKYSRSLTLGAEVSAESILSSIKEVSQQERSPVLLEILSRQFFEELLNYETVPDAYIQIVEHVLECKDIFSLNGADLFLYQIYASLDAVSEPQKSRLLNRICNNFDKYDKEMLCLNAMDFVARSFPAKVALDALETVSAKVKILSQKQAILFALDVIENHNKKNTDVLRKAGQIRKLIS